MLYKSVMKPILFGIDPEKAHNLVLGSLAFLQKSPNAMKLLEKMYGVRTYPELSVSFSGLRFPNPIGLAAGLDKDARAFRALSSLGFGFLEVGSVTPVGQVGNDQPRLFRLPKDKALINRMGFNNRGIQEMKRKLEQTSISIPLGINLGKNKNTPLEEAYEDYTKSIRLLYPYADFFVINISSPNTPDLRKLHYGSNFDYLLKNINCELDKQKGASLSHKPIFIKIAPDLDFGQLEVIIDKIMNSNVTGVIAANTTISRSGLLDRHKNEYGGLSGKPLHHRSTELIRSIYKQCNGRLKIIGSGGIFSSEDAYRKIRAGASIVEIYTSFVYRGPGINRDLNKGLLHLLKRDGFKNIMEAIGTEL